MNVGFSWTRSRTQGTSGAITVNGAKSKLGYGSILGRGSGSDKQLQGTNLYIDLCNREHPAVNIAAGKILHALG
jgi:hypothetical protein